MATRYINTGTVSDEHGKGAELLRIATARSTANTWANATYPLFVAEVDGIVRHVSVGCQTSPAAGGTLQASVNGTPVGTTLAIPTGNAVTARGEQTGVTFRRGELVGVVTAGSASGSHNVVFELGWMPDLWSQSADNKTYTGEA